MFLIIFVSASVNIMCGASYSTVNMEKEERENFDLFQPEILPKETLINLLNQVTI